MTKRSKAEQVAGKLYGAHTAAEEAAALQDINRILARLDREIPEAQKSMDELLSRLRSTRIQTAA
jgi:hypothetical protein